MLWDGVTNTLANAIYLYPGYNSNGIPNPPGTGDPISTLSTPAIAHYFNLPGIPTADGGIQFANNSEIASDYAVIDVATTFSSWVPAVGANPYFVRGVVYISGYPSVSAGLQTTNFGYVRQDPNSGILDYDGIGPILAGNSGGPVLLPTSGGSYVVAGDVSTGASALKLTVADLMQIQRWESADASVGAPRQLQE